VVSIGVAVAVSAFFVLVLAKVVQVRRRPASVGPQLIVGQHGHVGRDGLVSVKGELWQAREADGERLDRGEDVEVVALDGMELVVRRMKTPVGRVQV
jgi:membrane-bound ClpP family serine protease